MMDLNEEFRIKFPFEEPSTPSEDEKVYGGCQGPEAMYVKLISSDGHEFIVKRDHALTSGTIKAMMSGPGQFSEMKLIRFISEKYRLMYYKKFACISHTKSDIQIARLKSPNFQLPPK